MAGEQKITGILNKAGSFISAELKDLIQRKPVTKFGSVNASGKLKDSVHYDIKDYVMRVYALDYIYYVEHGRKAGKYPPKKAIRDWIESKPTAQSNFGWSVASESKKNSIVFLIQRKIAEEGTTIYKQGGSMLLEDILSNDLRGQIKSELILTFKEQTNALMKSAILGK